MITALHSYREALGPGVWAASSGDSCQLGSVIGNGVEGTLQLRIPALLVEWAADMVVLWIAGNVDPCILIVDARGKVAGFIGILTSDDGRKACSPGFLGQTNGVEHGCGKVHRQVGGWFAISFVNTQ